jgi:hypothetical protein
MDEADPFDEFVKQSRAEQERLHEQLRLHQLLGVTRL